MTKRGDPSRAKPARVATLAATAALSVAASAAAQSLDAPHGGDGALENGRDPAPRVETPLVDQSPSLDAPFAPAPDAAPDERAVREKAAIEAAETPDEDLTPEERLEKAFEKLTSETEEDWREAQEEITRLWTRSGSASADLLLRRGRRAMEREDWDAAETHLTDLVNLAPSFAEGWNLRATLYFQQDDYGKSIADIAETLALEPRHYGALTGLGLILEALDQHQDAMKAFRRALEVHPHLEGAKDAVKRLEPKAEGMTI